MNLKINTKNTNSSYGPFKYDPTPERGVVGQNVRMGKGGAPIEKWSHTLGVIQISADAFLPFLDPPP